MESVDGKQVENENTQRKEEDKPPFQLDDNVDREIVKEKMIHISKDIAEEDKQQNKTWKKQVYEPIQRLPCIRKKPKWFKVSGMSRKFTADELAVREALNEDRRDAWKSAINKDINNLQRMGCWKAVQRPKGEQVLHTRFVLKQKREEIGKTCNRKALLVVSVKERESD